MRASAGDIATSTGHLIQSLNKFFRYDPIILKPILEEFSEYYLLTLHGEALRFPSEFHTYEIRVMPKLFSLYDENRRGFLKDISYLNMCAMRAPVTKLALTREIPFFRALSLDEEGADISEWNTWELLNAISLYRLVKKASDLENQELAGMHRTLDRRERELLKFDPLLNFASELKEALRHQIDRIVIRFEAEGLERLLQAISKHKQAWT